MTEEEKDVKEFEKLFRLHDPEPISTSADKYCELTLREEREKREWQERYYSAKWGFLNGRRTLREKIKKEEKDG